MALRYDDDMHLKLTEEAYLSVLEAMQSEPQALGRLLANLHPADLADLLERLPRDGRAKLLNHIPYDILGEVVAELEEGVQQHVLGLLRPEEVRHAIAELDSDDAVDMAQAVEELSDDEDFDAADLIADRKERKLLDYDEDTAGGMMQLEVVTALPTQTVTEAMAYLREHGDEMPNNPGAIFVVTTRRKLLGTVSLHRLLKSPLSASMESIMRRNPLHATTETSKDEIINIFEKYDIHHLPVVNARMELLGRITIDDAVDAIQERAAHQIAAAAGVDEGEDLFAPATETARYRMPWLLINLATAILAAAVIAMFEQSIAQLTMLAVLMPIVASMGGNATTQTQTVIIRALALGQITKQNAMQLLRKEVLAGSFNGILLALLMAIGVGLLYSNWMLALVIALATVANHLIAAAAGWLVPLALKRFKQDPAIATGVVTTTFTDVGGFFVFLGLATLLLL